MQVLSVILFSVPGLPFFDNSPSTPLLENCFSPSLPSLHVLLEGLPIILSYDHVTQP